MMVAARYVQFHASAHRCVSCTKVRSTIGDGGRWYVSGVDESEVARTDDRGTGVALGPRYQFRRLGQPRLDSLATFPCDPN